MYKSMFFLVILLLIFLSPNLYNQTARDSLVYKQFSKNFLYPEELHAKAKDCLHRGQIKTAIEIFNQINETYPKTKFNEEGLFLSGYLYNNDLNDTIRAKKYYLLLLEKFPETVLKPSVEFELKHLGKKDFFPEFKE